MYRHPFRLLIFLLVFTPLAFGTVELWSRGIMEALSLLALWLVLREGLGHKNGQAGGVLYETPGVLLFLVFLSYMLFQLIPLPSGLVKLLSPEAYEVYARTAAAGEGPLGWVPLALSRKEALNEFFRLSSYGAVYFVTVQCLTDRRRLKRVVAVVVVFAALLSLFSMAQHLMSNGKIYWLREVLRTGAFFGPYVNRNHYAGLMEMLFPIVLAVFLYYKPQVSYASLRLRVAEILSQRATNISLLLGLSAVTVATSVFMTLSRGGIVSLGLSMVFFGLVLLLTEPSKGRAAMILSVFLVVVFAVGWFGWDPVFARFERLIGDGAQADMSRLRLDIWSDGTNLVRDFSVFGAGFGSFPLVYPKYRTITLEQTVNHAHNDYLELVGDGGIIALILAGVFVLAVLYPSARVFMRRRDGFSRYLFVGSLSGVVAMLIHSLIDFNLRNGANGLYFFFLLGLTVSAAHTRLHEGLKETFLKPRRASSTGGTAMRASTALLLVICVFFNGASLLGEARFSPVKDIKLNNRVPRGLLEAVKERGERASRAAPWEARYHFAVATSERLLEDGVGALKRYRAALMLDPLNGDYAQALGFALSEPENLVVAEGLISTGVWLDPSNPARHEIYVSWLFYQGMKDRGISRARAALLRAPRMTKDYITIMVLYGLSDEEIASAMPDRVGSHLRFAGYLIGLGKEEEAEAQFALALELAPGDEGVKISHFFVMHRYYALRERHSDALSVMRKGAEVFPRNVGIRLELAESYQRAGISYRAAEEYRNALIIDPRNKKAQSRLDAIR